jgi:hypothetical protein
LSRTILCLFDNMDKVCFELHVNKRLHLTYMSQNKINQTSSLKNIREYYIEVRSIDL